MGTYIRDLLPLAVGVALSPLAIVSVILVLFSARSRANSAVFAAGWIATLILIGTVSLLLAEAGGFPIFGKPRPVGYLVRLLLGVGCVYLAVAEWRKQQRPGKTLPGWMAGIDSFTPNRSLGLSALLAGANAKNIALLLAAAFTIKEAGLSGAYAWTAMGVFVVLASFTIVAPVLYAWLAGESATRRLTVWKEWLAANNSTILSVLMLFVGISLIGGGLAGLLG